MDGGSRFVHTGFEDQYWVKGHERATAALLQSVIDANGSCIAIVDDSLRILFVNRAWRELAARAGGTERFCIGSTYPPRGDSVASTSGRDGAAMTEGIRGLIKKREIQFRMEYMTTAVEPVWFRLHAAPFYFPGDLERPMVLVSHEDITAEKEAEIKLEKDRERISRLLDSTRILAWEATVGVRGFTYIGDYAEQLLGYPKEMWLEPNFWVDHLHPDDRQRALAESASLSQATGKYQYEYRMVGKIGRVVWINDIVTIHHDRGIPFSISGYMVDITQRKAAEKTLMLLSGRLITAQEDERKRIARELHDDLNQRMALMSIELEQIGQRLTDKAGGLSGHIQELQRKAMRMSQEIHRMSYELHPSKLDHLGLGPALRSFCSELAERRRMRVNFRQQGAGVGVPADVTLCLFRVAQEALQNSAKHSGGSQVDVVLTVTEEAATLNVSDSGCGFDMNNGKMNEGLGFVSMRERLRLVNGTLDIQSKPFRGTRINVSVPLSNVVTVPPILSTEH
jgi:PAS domain S-box-containing protein